MGIAQTEGLAERDGGLCLLLRLIRNHVCSTFNIDLPSFSGSLLHAFKCVKFANFIYHEPTRNLFIWALQRAIMRLLS